MSTFAAQQPTISKTLEANVQALQLRSPGAARAVAAVAPVKLEWCETDQPGTASACMDGRSLASKRMPLEEAQRFADRANLHDSAVMVVLGFGLGYHVEALAKKAEQHSLVVAFEPNASLLRAVFERVDCTAWLIEHNVVILTSAEDRAGATASLKGAEALFAVGVEFLEHAPSKPRLGDEAGRFAQMLTSIIEAMRTVVITTMVHTEITIRNELMNALAYAGGAGLDDLVHIARDRPAIVVSAGPSLRRNIELLSDPMVRDRFVIIAVQTVLKTLLTRGIKPHFVTALDYHEISKRFYEGLSESDVEGITLVAEPKANSAIIDAWPGALRLAGTEMLDRVLGKSLARTHATIEPGATVAHLAYYLGRSLGCDPVILIGQDLAFTDGQYYARGAVIHDVWAPELNAFNTLEMMEWQRIVRGRSNLHVREDHLGRSVYTDDQMLSYLSQFERDFKGDTDRGLTTIDATEGGVRKAHTDRMSLDNAIERYAPETGDSWTLPAVRCDASPGRVRQLRRRLDSVRGDVKQIEKLARQTEELLGRMSNVAHDQPRLNALIDGVQALRDRVEKIQPAYWLVHRLNQTGTFKRFKADRALHLETADLSPKDVQLRQIERDTMNVRWLGDAAASLVDLLDSAARALPPECAPKLTRDRPASNTPLDDAISIAAAAPAITTAALLMVDLDEDPFGRPRDLSESIAGKTLLRHTLERLAKCKRLSRAVLASNDETRLRAVIGGPIEGLEIEVVPLDVTRLQARSKSLRGARLWASTSWRGGLGFATIWDEVFDPGLACQLMDQTGITSALVVGPDWILVDPELCDQVIERHQESPESHQIAFMQAPSGLCGCVVGRAIAGDLAKARADGDSLASIGGALGFRPMKPRLDPIGTSACVQVDPLVRGALGRFTAEDQLTRTLAGRGVLKAAQVAEAWRKSIDTMPDLPRELIVEICARRSRSSPLSIDRPDFNPDALGALVSSLTQDGAAPLVTLGGFGDPMCHERVTECIGAAVRAGARAVHVRTELLCEPSLVDQLVASGADVISVDLHANSAPVYAKLTGADRCGQALDNTQRLMAARKESGGWLAPWVVPRILRCDAVYEEIEGFFDKSIVFAGASVIDQLDRPREGERIEPLGKPVLVRRRDARARMMVLSDGSVLADERDGSARASVGNVFREEPICVWRSLTALRKQAMGGERLDVPEDIDPLWTGW